MIKLKLEFYHANDGYRWRTVEENGEITGASTQGFSRFIDCRDNYRMVSTAGTDDALAAVDVSDERTGEERPIQRECDPPGTGVADPFESQTHTPEN